MNDGEMYILSSIFKYLNEKDYFIYSSYDIPQSSQYSQVISNQISQCDLFIGIASYLGIQSSWVLKEWEIAQKLKKTSIFLVEDNVNLNPDFLKTNSVIYFNRQNPQNSLFQLENLIENARKEKQKNATNLIVGGLIGIALIKMLSDD